MDLNFFHNPNFLMLQTIIIAVINMFVPFLFNGHRFLKQLMMLLVSIIFFINIVNIDNFYLNGGRTTFELMSLGGFSIKFYFEGLGLLFLTMVSFLWILASTYTISFIKFWKVENISKFLFFTSSAVLVTTLIALSANLFTLFIFYEILTIVTMPLIVYGENSPHFQRSLKSYATILLTNASFLLFPFIMIINYYCGTTDFVPKGIMAGKIDSDLLISIILLMSIYGSAKSALFPFHSWLPNAMVASYPVSALFHAVLVVKVGLFTTYKIIIYIFGLDFLSSFTSNHNWVIYIPIFTIFYSSILAIRQDMLKKMLAYSTISQLAFSIMSLFLFGSKAVVAAVLHMLAHSFAKITLFYSAGNIYTATYKTKIEDMQGIGFILPRTFLCFFIGAISLIGIPPLAGFVSKYYIIYAIVSSNDINYPAFITALFSSIMTAIYFLRVIYIGYHRPKIEVQTKEKKIVPSGMMIVTILCALCTLFFFTFAKIAVKFLEFVY